jgi:hypothetical protein
MGIRRRADFVVLDYVMKEGADAFGFSIFGSMATKCTIPWRVEYIRGRMRAFGYENPSIVTEYGRPGFYEFPINR